MTTIVTTFSERRRMKRWEFERGVLRNLSLDELKQSAERTFPYLTTYPFLLDPCIDMAIDSFLMGAEYSRFGYFGESEEQVMNRCDDELTDLIYSLFTLLQSALDEETERVDFIHFTATDYIKAWWRKGYKEGIRRYQLKL